MNIWREFPVKNNSKDVIMLQGGHHWQRSSAVAKGVTLPYKRPQGINLSLPACTVEDRQQ
jgi:hypothetical protein